MSTEFRLSPTDGKRIQKYVNVDNASTL